MPVDVLDQAASAAVDAARPDPDGEGIDLEPDADPSELAVRVELFASIAAQVAAPTPTPEPSVVDDHVAAALAAFDQALASGSSDDGAGPTAAIAADRAVAGDRQVAADRAVGPAVAPIGAHRRRRPNAGRWLAVAAAIAVVLLAIPVVRSLSSPTSSKQDTAASSADTVKSQESAASPSGADSRSDQSATDGSSTTRTTATTPVSADSGVNLGSASSGTELAALVHDAAPQAATAQGFTATTAPADSTVQPSTASTTTIPQLRASFPGCDAVIRANRPELGALRFSGSAVYKTVPVEVAVYETTVAGEPGYRLFASTQSDCSVLVDQAYP